MKVLLTNLKYLIGNKFTYTFCLGSGRQCHYDREPQPRAEEGSYVQSLEQHIQTLSLQLQDQSSRNTELMNEAARLRESCAITTANQQSHTSPLSTVATSPLSPIATQPATTFPVNGEINTPAESPVDSEITEVNRYTNAFEFHGSTSSVAFLGNLQRLSGHQPARLSYQNASLVSELHNSRFSAQAKNKVPPSAPPGEAFYFKHAHLFIDAYFSGIHYIHPFIDREDFRARSNNLWFGKSPHPTNSFIALYLSLLSVGALTRTWEEERLDGLTRFEWSRKLFAEAQVYLNETQFSNDLDTVHCLYLIVGPLVSQRMVINMLILSILGQNLSE